MRTHLGCTGRVELGTLSDQTQRRLERIEATWLEFSPEPPALVVRHVQPDDLPPLREIGGELLEFLGGIPENERGKILGGALYYLDEETGQYVRLKVWAGGFLTVAWAKPDYAHASREPYHGQTVPLVFDAYQRLNGIVRLEAQSSAVGKIQAVIERFGGLYPQGDFEARVSGSLVEIQLRDVNCSAFPLLEVLRNQADPASSLEGEIDVSSFRTGDLEEYWRFVLRAGDVWLVRPSLWSDVPQPEAGPPGRLEHAA